MKVRTSLISLSAAACLALASLSSAAPVQAPPAGPAGSPVPHPKPALKPAVLARPDVGPVARVPDAPRAVDGGTAAAPAATHVLDAADLAAWLDGRVPYALKTGDIAGLTLAVVKDGKVLLTKGYGYADVKDKVAMDPDTSLVRIGSTSKLFTWTAVMQLVQQGKLDLARDVNDYIDFKIAEPYGRKITLRDLMNHRAGFEEGLKDLLGYDPATAQTTEQYLKQHPRPMLFAPGEVAAYSNYGVALAGYIVERVSGEPFAAYVDRHIFKPLGMNHSTFDQPVPKGLPGVVAKGYRTASEPPAPFELVITAPAGAVSTTAADMTRFMLAHLQQGSLDGVQMLDPATTALMHSPTETSLPGFGVMAHGFFSATQNGRLVLGHGGDTIVFHTEMNLLPQENVGIFFTYNSRGKDEAVYAARQELFDGFMDRYFPAAHAPVLPTLATAAADAQAIAGRYQSSRRVEHGFLSVLYLLSQTVIVANRDGTITAPDGPGTMGVFREVGPQLWRKVGGEQLLALRQVNGVKTVLESANPIAVLQQASFARSAPLNLTVLGLSVFILLATLLLWPIGALLRRAERAASGLSAAVRRLRLVQRVTVVLGLVYLAAWWVLIAPVLKTEIALYATGLDWVVGLMEASGLLLFAAALGAIWAAWRLCRSDAPRLARIWSVLVALALVGVVWVAWIGQLMAWTLNY